MGQQEEKKRTAVATTPVTPVKHTPVTADNTPVTAENTPITGARASSGLAGTCANCGRQYLKRNTHHYKAHILK